jgi:hypothetical protein
MAHSQLSTHSTRTGRRANIRRNTQRLKLPMTFRNRLAKRNPLRTCAYRVRCILDIRAINVFVVVSEDRRTDAES